MVRVGLAQARHELAPLLDVANVGAGAAAEAVEVRQVPLGVDHRLALDVVRRLRRCDFINEAANPRTWSSFTLIMALRADPT